MGGFVCRAVLPARANVAKRLRTWLRRAVALGCWVFADVSVLEHNGQAVLSEFVALPTILINAAKKGTCAPQRLSYSRGAVLFTLRVGRWRYTSKSGVAGALAAANSKTSFENRPPQRRASALLPLDAAT